MSEADYLAHYGILRKSGRYPWGSGNTQSARNRSFLDTVEIMKNQGMSDADIAKAFSTDEQKFTSTNLRALKSIALNEQKQGRINQAYRLKEKGYSNVKIGEIMGLNESTVRSLLDPSQQQKADVLQATADMLRRQVAEKEYLDVGAGSHLDLPLSDGAPFGIADTKFKTAIAILQEEGYKLHYLRQPQAGTTHETTFKILTKPGVPWTQVRDNKHKIQQISEHSPDGGESFTPPRAPSNVSSKRVAVRYGKDGGAEKDGLIELRPGVKDLDMGGAQYSQVRIAVDKTHYIKGMAVYNKDLPPGVDILFNTNKATTGDKLDALKPMEKGPDGKPNLMNPFTSSIKPGGQRGALNIVYEEGDWDKWSKSLPSQMLSKQSPDLAKTQLSLTVARRREQMDEIMGLTNPTVRRKLLESFADDVDSSAVMLEAAAMPKQATRVLLPIPSVKPTEIYAPSFRDGERVALVRFPHGGIFEIPELTVNNRNGEAKRIMGTSPMDAVGINSKVAEKLSGADFDGDNVLVIPNNRGSVKSKPALQDLKGFDPRAAYPEYPGMIPITGRNNSDPARKGKEMGKITNLIADMTIMGASDSELARAVRHSMVVIDAEKHNLDFKSSARDNGISQLKAKYQGKSTAGASTLITRGPAKYKVDERKPRPAKEGGPVDRETGKLVFVPTGRTYTNKKGQVVPAKVGSRRLADTHDAHTLVSDIGTRIERIYADHSNDLKSIANQARKEAVNTKPIPYNKSAKAVYAKEVAELNSALRIAKLNAPLERQAQVVADHIFTLKKQADPNMDKEGRKKAHNQALAEARIRTGAKKKRIKPTQEQWTAIQAGAISPTKLKSILDNADLDDVKKLATPKTTLKMTSAKTNHAKALLAAGYTQAEVADQLGVSLTTLKTSIIE